MIMRELPKYCRTKEGKKEIIRLVEEVEPVVPTNECFDRAGKPLAVQELDAIWASKYKEPITRHLKKASKRHEAQKERETPLELLQAAYKKLTHGDMDVKAIVIGDLKKARELAIEIGKRAGQLEDDIFHAEKEAKKLEKRK